MASQRRPRITAADRDEWARYARLVRPLPGRVRPDVQDAPGRPTAVDTPAVAPLSVAKPRPSAPAPVMVGAQPPGVDNATWAKLRTGKLGTVRALDLHGLRVRPAYESLIRFILAAHADRVRCVEIVTGLGSGEGGGVIRREFPLWLNQSPIRAVILAAAHPHAANQGAVRLLLRKPRR